MIVKNEIKPATYDMVKYACLNYHYAETVPRSTMMSFAIFEEQKFIGVFVFSLGSNNHIARPFGLKQGEVIELTRIALRPHKNPVTYYLSRCIKLIKKNSPSVKMIVSYSDIDRQKHVGKIYQANNWLFMGTIHNHDKKFFYRGKWRHERTLNDLPPEIRQKMKDNLPCQSNSDKFKYIFPMTKKLMKHWRKFSKPYPHSVADKD